MTDQKTDKANTEAGKKKTWVTRYGSPETRTEVEHDDGDCPACVVAGGMNAGQVVFVQVEAEGATPATDDAGRSIVLRRCERWEGAETPVPSFDEVVRSRERP